jgi:hypothetical protein
VPWGARLADDDRVASPFELDLGAGTDPERIA